MDPEPIPSRPLVDPSSTPSRPQIEPEPTPNRPPPDRNPSRHEIGPNSTPGSPMHPQPKSAPNRLQSRVLRLSRLLRRVRASTRSSVLHGGRTRNPRHTQRINSSAHKLMSRERLADHLSFPWQLRLFESLGDQDSRRDPKMRQSDSQGWRSKCIGQPGTCETTWPA